VLAQARECVREFQEADNARSEASPAGSPATESRQDTPIARRERWTRCLDGQEREQACVVEAESWIQQQQQHAK
jgi:hypothetical protein